MIDLNTEQLAVVNSDAPKVLCPASAGSGKSRTGVEWIKKQIADGYDPKTIIAISFTNSASDVLQQRLGDVRLGANTTLHSFLLRLIQKHPSAVGLPEQLSVIDDESREGIIQTIIDEHGKKVTPKNVLPHLNNVILFVNPKKARSREELIAVEYFARLRRSGLLDFKSILWYGQTVISKMREAAIWPYKVCMWDEYQDSAIEDHVILTNLPCEKILCLGDDKQSIFSFRDGHMENMLDLTHRADWTILPLTKNYRCKSKIQEAASRLIAHNENQIPIETIASDPGGTVVVEPFDVPAGEFAFVSNELTRSKNGNGRAEDSRPARLDELKETAVLCRTNYLAEQFAAYLEGLGIPVAKKKPAVVPADWRKAKLLLTVMANPHNDMAVHQFLIADKGKSAADVFRRDAAKNMVSLFDHAMATLRQANKTDNPMASAMAMYGLSHESRERIHDACRQLPVGWSVQDLIIFLGQDAEESQQVGSGVFVGTVHSAKGKEWDQVFLCGVEHPWYPGRDSLEESRRLLYVGLTRARRRVVLTWAKARPQWRGDSVRPGPMEDRVPSQFLFEMGL